MAFTKHSTGGTDGFTRMRAQQGRMPPASPGSLDPDTQNPSLRQCVRKACLSNKMIHCSTAHPLERQITVYPRRRDIC